MKKKFLVVLCVTILALVASIVALQATTEPTFNFALEIDGKSEKTVSTGDIITLVFTIERTDKDEPYTMTAFQNEIRYDDTFFELVKDGMLIKDGVRSDTNLKVSPYDREQYLNFLSYSGGVKRSANWLVGSLQLRVIAESGASFITNEDPSVSRIGGSGSYAVTTESVLVIVSNDLTVTFDTGEGSAVASQIVKKGGKVTRPADPTREGYIFAGWYTDTNCTKLWDFTTPVEANLHLYAGWKKVGSGPHAPVEKFPFIDVTTKDWFYDSVYYAWKNGLMVGTSDNLFSPNLATTRAMIVTIIHRQEKTPKSEYNMTFNDVGASTWYTDSVRWAAEQEIVLGYDALTFMPNKDISRQEMVAIMYRYAKFKGYDVTVADDVTLDAFTDVGDIAPYAVEAVRWAYDRGLIKGMGDGTIAPQGLATRAQVAAIFMRFRENIK